MRERVAAESAEQREVRLQHMRERVAAESAGQREARLQRFIIMLGFLMDGRKCLRVFPDNYSRHFVHNYAISVQVTTSSIKSLS